MAQPYESKKKPTLKTISSLTGLAVPTVSRALNDAPDIGKETKKRVREVAREIGYVPNRAGVRLRTGRTNVIALVMSTEYDIMNHTSSLITSISGGLRGTNFHLNVTPYFPVDDPMAPVRYVVETGSADAIILNQTKPDDPRIRYLLERGFPFATHGRTNLADKHPYFDFDNRIFGAKAVDMLADRGRKNLLFITAPFSQFYGREMIEGSQEMAKELGVNLCIPEHITSDNTSAEIKEFVAQKVAQHPEIDGIITASTNSCMASVAGMETQNRFVGPDMDICAKEAIPFLTLFREGILAFQENVHMAGDFLAKAAVQAIRDPEKAPLQQIETPEFPDI
ncbi:LacI family transcriptional regulator [Aestuariibius sp. HNIBRBA575]|uniref:LacI family transcriptional regulator n=1 Tax=Aestuariibius sp. HNIBRBA575 TaxID=3233343 RepID=UPI0034A11CCF